MFQKAQDYAAICLNGHLVNSATNVNSTKNRDYCVRCGKKVITEYFSSQ